jgi:CDP-2,3-bis-(O-geranylgeranyl)-sn-glycerol synthase
MLPILEVLILVVWANGVPVLADLILGHRFRYPLDGGRRCSDGNRLLGDSKTWRGLGVAVLTTPLIAVLFGFSWVIGLIAAFGAMLGDIIASFFKRRLGRPSGDSFFLLDQVPETLIPVLLVQGVLDLSLIQGAVIVIGFTLIDLGLTPLGARLRRISERIMARILPK